MPDSRLTALLDRKWPNIAIFAYREFLEHGRGIVALELSNVDDLPDADLQYVVYPEPDKDAQVSALLASYDPDSGVLIHYLDEQGSVHTMRLHAATDARRPEALWLRHCFLRRPPLTREEIQSSIFSDDKPLA